MKNVLGLIMKEIRTVEVNFEEEKRILTEADVEENKEDDSVSNKSLNESFLSNKNDVPNKGGKFVRVEGENFDVILNILIGIRRSLNNVSELPGQQLTD